MLPPSDPVTSPGGNAAAEPALTADAVEAQLLKISGSTAFRASRRRRELLSWLVRRTHSSRDAAPKEHEIGIAVFGKPESWDPRLDSAVRVEFNRLRNRLAEYYESEGKDDAVRIEFPHRGYAPVINTRANGTAEPAFEQILSIAAPAEADSVPTLAPFDTSPRQSAQRRFPVGRAFWAASAALLLAGAIFAGFRLHLAATGQTHGSKSLAVLPFSRNPADAGDQYLSDGVTEEISGKLATSDTLRVAGRESAFRFREAALPVNQIARALGVDAVVRGSFQKNGDLISVRAHLFLGSDGAEIWSGSYERTAADLSETEDDIAHAIASALGSRIATPRDAPLALDGEVHDRYLLGVYETQKMTPDSLVRAMSIFNAILRVAPRYALSYQALGRVHLNLAGMGAPHASEEMRKAKTGLEQAVSLDPSLSGAHADLAYVNYVLDWNWPAAEQHFREAIRLSPGGDVHEMYGFALMTRGHFDEANSHFRAAIERDPLNSMMRLNFATVLNEEGRFDEAMQQVRFCLDRDPGWFPGHLLAGYTAIYSHHPEQALAYLEGPRKLAPGNPLVLAALAGAYAEMGQRSKALSLLAKIQASPQPAEYSRYFMAMVEGLLADAPQVFYWLTRSAELHEQQILYIRVEPLLATFRADPRMVSLERRIGLL